MSEFHFLIFSFSAIQLFCCLSFGFYTVNCNSYEIEKSETRNDKVFGEFQCVSCDSKEDDRCRNHPELLSRKTCELTNSIDKDLGCYLFHDDFDRVRRGCVSDLTEQLHKMCLNKSDQCKICKESDCNTKVQFQHCYTCTSKDILNCAHNISSELNSAELYRSICPNYMDQCLMALDSEGYTVRQCFLKELVQMEELEKFSMHDVCEENMCNGGMYPENRIQCFQCDGDETCNSLEINKNEPLEEMACKVYSKYDECFMYLDEGEKIKTIFFLEIFIPFSFDVCGMN